MTYIERQQAQLERYQRWAEAEGGKEGIVLYSTLMQSNQRKRLDWLREHARGRILEVGTNWGYALGWVNGHVGIDISPAAIALARLLQPDKEFFVALATDLPFPSDSFDTVLLPEVLEHLTFPDEVDRALQEAYRVTRHRIVITIPDGTSNSKEATNFKHQWLYDIEYKRRFSGLISKIGVCYQNCMLKEFVGMVITVGKE